MRILVIEGIAHWRVCRGANAVGEFLIYGATGYTGRLAAEHAVERGLRPVLAGRNGDALQPLADSLHLPWRVFGLERRAELVRGLVGITAVLHAAGPFSATAVPMAEACLAAGVHYCDITGEIDVFETLAGRGARARTIGIMLMPGVGFDVVPSDCLAAHAAARLPDATQLRLSIGGLTRASRGTAKTMVEAIARGTRVRSDDRIVVTESTPRGVADFGAGLRATIGVSWGDVSTAWHSTGIPNIAVFFEADRATERAASMPAFVKGALGADVVQRFLKAQIDRRLPPGPTAKERSRGRAVVVAEARNATGKTVVSRLSTPEPYALTAMTAVEIVRRAAEGEGVPGFQTPSAVFRARLHHKVPRCHARRSMIGRVGAASPRQKSETSVTPRIIRAAPMISQMLATGFSKPRPGTSRVLRETAQ